MEITKKLFELKDEKYKAFSAKLLPDKTKLIGVRLPVLRKLSKEIIKGDYEAFLNQKSEYLEEKLLKGMTIGLIGDYKKAIKYIESFIPEIDNWSVCDSTVASLKIVKSNKKEFFKFIQKYLKSKKEYELRFGLVSLLWFYVDIEHSDFIFNVINNLKTDKYYAMMAGAWLFSVCYVKLPLQSEEKILKEKTDKTIYKKGVQKVLDSYRVDKKLKEKLKNSLTK